MTLLREIRGISDKIVNTANLLQPKLKEVTLRIPANLSAADEFKLRCALARCAANMTQDSLGQALGWSHDVICRIENGRQQPNALDLQRIAHATGQSLQVFQVID